MTRIVLAVFLVALGARAAAAERTALIARDGVGYLAVAERLADRDVRGALAHHYPPGYPALVAVFGSGEGAGQAASVLAGALGAVAAACIGRQLGGRRGAWLAGLLAALLPASVELGSAVLADALFATLGLAALALALRGLWPLAGALAAASYLARPEGIVLWLGLALAVLVRARRLLPPLLVLAPALLVALPYVVVIREHASLTGGESGAWKLTKKRELFLEAGGERVFPRGPDGARRFHIGGAASVAAEANRRAATQVRETAFAAKEALALLVLAIAMRRARRPELSLVAVPSLGLLAAWSLIRTDERYGAILATLLVPWIAAAVERPHRGALALVLVGSLVWSGRAPSPLLEARDHRKVTWRLAGEACRGLPAVASKDTRPAFYAGARHVDLFGPLLAPSSPGERARAVLDAARAGGASVLAIGPREDFVGPLLELAPGSRIEVVQRAGAETVTLVHLAR